MGQLEKYHRASSEAFEAHLKIRGLASDYLFGLVARLESPHADKVYLAKEYTKADLIRDLRRLID